MNENKAHQLLLKIIGVELNAWDDESVVEDLLTENTLTKLYSLAKKHDLAHIVSKYINRHKIEVPSEIKEKFQREELLSIYRYEQIKYTFGEICAILDGECIPYIPLKGSVIRPYYPYESMRTSCDIDILIKEEDLKKAITVLSDKGYNCGEKNYHDVSIYSKNNVHLELHFSVKENDEKLDEILGKVWDYAVPAEKYCYRLNDEFFVFYIYAHMSYHFLSGGCGLRALMDIWIMENKMNVSHFDSESLLEKAGIYKFASEMSTIANNCFLCENDGLQNDIALSYILSGGSYGDIENKVAVKKTMANGFLAYAIGRIFMPYKSMKTLYPFLGKFPFLLPFCWIARWVRTILNGRSKKIANEFQKASAVSSEKMNEIKALSMRMGL